MLQPDQQMQVDGAAAMVELRGGLLGIDVAASLPVLVLEAAEEVHDGSAAAAVLGGEDVATPRSSVGSALRRAPAVGAGEQALSCLGQDVGDVERLGSRQAEARPQQLGHLVLNPGVKRKTPLIWSDGEEDGRKA